MHKYKCLADWIFRVNIPRKPAPRMSAAPQRPPSCLRAEKVHYSPPQGNHSPHF